MMVAVLGIDLAKRVFHLHGVDAHGRAVVSKRVSRAEPAETVVRLAPKVVAVEACCGAHHWDRRFHGLGLEVRLIHARFVRAYVKSVENDARDAEAMREAVLRPHMRFVPLKSQEQLDIQALHRVRERARAVADHADQPDARLARRARDRPAARRVALPRCPAVPSGTTPSVSSCSRSPTTRPASCARSCCRTKWRTGRSRPCARSWSRSAPRGRVHPPPSVRHGRHVVFQLAEVAVPRALFAAILRRIDRLRGPPAAAA
jgi:hypothetical protein